MTWFLKNPEDFKIMKKQIIYQRQIYFIPLTMQMRKE